MNKEKFFQLVEKYHAPAGRYNYYPRISQWEDNLTYEQWYAQVHEVEDSLDLYFHIPFCDKFCHFCGCNIKVNQPEQIKQKYLEKMVKEWKSYDLSASKIKNIFFGGGTPNSLSLEHYKWLFEEIGIDKDQCDISIEADPRKLDFKLIQLLRDYGLSSISFGVQDFDQDVLDIIGRPTDLDKLRSNLIQLKEYKIEHTSIDLLYGLPLQNKESLSFLREILKEKLINSASLYPFANVPWFQDFYPLWTEHKPDFKEKYGHYFEIITLLEEFDILPISFGHFAHKSSRHYRSFLAGSLRRNIMGHTLEKSPILIGLGVSAISSTPKALKQNSKIFENYMFQNISFDRSHLRSSRESNLEKIFEELSTRNTTIKTGGDLEELIHDGLICSDAQKGHIQITPLGRHFVQHIARFLEKSL